MRLELWQKEKLLAMVAVGERPRQAEQKDALMQEVSTYEYGRVTLNQLLKALARDVSRAVKNSNQDSNASRTASKASKTYRANSAMSSERTDFAGVPAGSSGNSSRAFAPSASTQRRDSASLD